MRRAFEVALATAFIVVTAGPASASAQGPRERATAWLEAMELPEAAHELRVAGTPTLEVRIAVGALRRSVGEAEGERASRRAARILRAEVLDAREHGPMDNFGFFVRTKVEGGLRGQELARAIREHRGNRGAGQGRPDAAGQAQGRGDGVAPGRAETVRSSTDRRPAAVPGRSGAAGPSGRATPARGGAANQGAQRQPVGGRGQTTKQEGTQRGPSRR